MATKTRAEVPWVVFDGLMAAFKCLRCEVTKRPGLPMPVNDFVRKSNAFTQAHKDCTAKPKVIREIPVDVVTQELIEKFLRNYGMFAELKIAEIAYRMAAEKMWDELLDKSPAIFSGLRWGCGVFRAPSVHWYVRSDWTTDPPTKMFRFVVRTNAYVVPAENGLEVIAEVKRVVSILCKKFPVEMEG